MDDRRKYHRPSTMEPWDGDGLTREPLSPEPRSPWSSWAFPQSTSTRLLLGALAVLLVVTVVGTTALVIRDLRGQPVQATSVTPTVAPSAMATVAPTPTFPPPYRPQDDGWTEYTAGVAGGRVVGGDVKFSQSSPQRGYLCGEGPNGRIFAVTTDGGQTWVVGQSPAANYKCSIQISPTNPLDVVVNSQVGSCGDPCPNLDAHYSSDGGKTWKAAPIPSNTVWLGGGLWSGAYLYVWSGANDNFAQHSFLKVSANGGPFATIDLNTLLPGAQNIAIQSAIGASDHLYLNLGYTGCSAQNCQAIVASGDGGKTWTQVPNQSSIQLMAVAANTLYGQAPDAQDPKAVTEWTSGDSGATWTRLELPPLPGGLPVPLCWPTPYGALVGPTGVGVAYLRGGVWTIIPGPYTIDLAVGSLGANGHPQRVWAIDDSNDYLAGIYWHALP